MNKYINKIFKKRTYSPKKFITHTLTATLIVLFFIEYIDEKVVELLNNNNDGISLFSSIIISTPVILGFFSVLYALFYSLQYQTFSRCTVKNELFFISITCLVIVTIKNFLKIAFGRTWPNNKPSFFPDDNIAKGLPQIEDSIVEGFYPFSGLREFASFPSGSVAVTICVLFLLGYSFPRMRSPALLLSALVSIQMIATNIHFVSDVIAGIFLGYVVAQFSLRVHGFSRKI